MTGYRVCLASDSIKFYTANSFSKIYYKTIPEIILAVIIGFLPGMILYLGGLAPDISNLTDTAKIWLIGIMLATFGWIATGIVSQQISRKRHTVDILLNQTFSNEYRKLAHTILARYPNKELISKNEANLLINCSEKFGIITEDELYDETKIGEKVPTLDNIFNSLRALLNFYEFIATGIKHDDLDAHVLFDYYHNVICNFCEKTSNYIIARRKFNEDETLYENLIDLYIAWKPSDTFPEL